MVKQELVDVVDKKGRVIGVVSRKEAHLRKIMHPSVRVLLFNTKGELFVQQRSRTKDVEPGAWEGSLAGHVNHGETPLHAAMRETREELGLSIPASRFRKVGTHIQSNLHEHTYYTVYAVKGVKAVPKINHKEVIQGHWEPITNLRKQLKSHAHKYRPSFLVAWHLFSKKR